MKLEETKIVRIYKTDVWVENDMCGSQHVVVQHENCETFTYASFHYDYRYTVNSGIYNAANRLAVELGATEPVVHKSRPMHDPSIEEIKSQIEAMQLLLKYKLEQNHDQQN